MYKAKVTEGFGLTHWHANTDVPCAYPLGPREYSPSVRASVTTRTPCTMSKPARMPNFASAAVAVAAACGLASAMAVACPRLLNEAFRLHYTRPCAFSLLPQKNVRFKVTDVSTLSRRLPP